MRKKALLVLLAVLCIAGLTACEYPASYAQAAYALGLETGKTYPLVLGDKVNGSVGSVTTDVGFFSVTTTVAITPGSAVTVIFKKDDREWHLEIPTSRTTFVIKENTEQTVVLTLSGNQYGGSVNETGSDGASCTHSAVTSPGCEAKLPDSVRDAGLGPIVQGGLVSAVFTVNQATADLLSGKK